MKRLKAAIKSKKPKEYEDYLSLPVGDVWFRNTYNAIYNSNKTLLGVEIISHDITEPEKSRAGA